MKTETFIKHVLDKNIYLLPYFIMAVSFLFVLLPKFGYNVDRNFWSNLGGYSIFTNIICIRTYYFDKNYCKLTRYLPLIMIFISVLNISASFLPEKYNIYSELYEIIIFSVILFISFIVELNRRIKKWLH